MSITPTPSANDNAAETHDAVGDAIFTEFGGDIPREDCGQVAAGAVAALVKLGWRSPAESAAMPKLSAEARETLFIALDRLQDDDEFNGALVNRTRAELETLP